MHVSEYFQIVSYNFSSPFKIIHKCCKKYLLLSLILVGEDFIFIEFTCYRYRNLPVFFSGREYNCPEK